MAENPVERLYSAVRTVADYPEPGIQFKDITPLLLQADLVRSAVELLRAPFENAGVTKIAAIESRGFILGSILAETMGVGFVPIRKKGKLPWKTVGESYNLEYGTDVVEMHIDAVGPGDVVLIHDDVIATGGTAAAAGRLIRQCGATIAGYSFLIELGFLEGRNQLLADVACQSVLTFD